MTDDIITDVSTCYECGVTFKPFQVGNMMLGIKDRCMECTRVFYSSDKLKRPKDEV